ncbi:MAG: phage terminase small subunit P27 family [Dehalococcoidia bacterium]
MKPGAKPLPTNVKRLHGTLRKHRMHGHEPQVTSDLPSCPRELSKAAKREWRRIAPELAQLGLLARIDRAALALYCDAWGRWVEAQQALQKYGVVVKSPNGFPMQSPYLAIANKALDQMRLLLGEFGMSPSSRTRVHAARQDEEDEFSEFERGRA